MQAGKLRNRIQVQRKTEVEDGYGGISQAWNAITTRWGEIIPVQIGGENWQAERSESKATHTIRLRYIRDLKTDDRLMCRSIIYNIERIVNTDFRMREITVNVIEQT